MILIKKVRIVGFRSIRDDQIDNIGNFSALVGLNNSGKSNYLRAINLFFNDEIEPGVRLNMPVDYYKPDISKRRKRKEISVEVTFELPTNFKFHKRLKEVEKMLNSHNFTITKLWTKESSLPKFVLNNKFLDFEEQQKIQQFLSLVTFRYIPNRTLPIDLIKKEHQSLRDVLIRRVSKSKPAGADEVFDKLANISKRLISGLYKDLLNKIIIPDFEDIRLDTPASFSDMVFAFGYKLKQQGFEIDDSLQGSGIQNLLMFYTLHLIDKDYFQKFGWRQASIWGIEEPESSLHLSLAARVGSFLYDVASGPNNRLQVLATTHSEVIIQFSDQCYYVKNTPNGSKSESKEVSSILEEAVKSGTSGWQHPLLRYPLKILVIVDGKYDVKFFKKSFELINPKILNKCEILSLENISLSGKEETGGTDATIKYLKANARVIKNRHSQFPVIVILDWEKTSKKQEIIRYFERIDQLKVLNWEEEKANPSLGKGFTGMERFLPDRIINLIKAEIPQIVTYNQAARSYIVEKENYGTFKAKASEIIERELKKEDLKYADHILKEIQKLIDNPGMNNEHS